MPVTPARAKKIALSLEDASERPHFDRTAIRTPRKTFATLTGNGADINLMFDPELRDFYCEQTPSVFSPVPGGWAAWARRGAISRRWTSRPYFQRSRPRTRSPHPRLRGASVPSRSHQNPRGRVGVIERQLPATCTRLPINPECPFTGSELPSRSDFRFWECVTTVPTQGGTLLYER